MALESLVSPAGQLVDEALLARLREILRDDFRTAQVGFDATSEDVLRWIKRHTAELVTQVTDTTRRRIRQAVYDLAETGDWEVAVAAIEKAVGDEDRAELIARHESMLAASAGQRLGWGQARRDGLLTGRERRVWIITPAGACPVCVELEDATAPLNGAYPGGYDGPPAHVNCRCTEGIVG